MRMQIVQLAPYDDAVSVRDRLAFAKAERVLLVLPPDAHILTRKLDLVLIQREAARRGLRLALVTHDPHVIDHARELGLSIFAATEHATRRRWQKPQNKVFLSQQERPHPEVDLLDRHELALRASRLRALSPRQRRGRRLARGGAMLALVLTTLLVFYMFLPSAEVILTPAQGQIDATQAIIADPRATQIDAERGRVPANRELVDVETRANIPTSGLQDVPNSRARGEVQFLNRIESAVEIPAGTLLKTPIRPNLRRSVTFRVVETVLLPAGVNQVVTAPIEAADDSQGVVGNVEAGAIINIEGELSRILTVRNLEPTTGGTVRETGVVTQEDYDNLLQAARTQLRQTALAQISARLRGTQIVVPNSLQILNEGSEETVYSAFIGDLTETLTITIRAQVSALVIDEADARQVMLAQLSRQIPSGQRLLLDTIRYHRAPLQAADADGRVTFLMSASASVMASIDQTLVRQRIAGLDTQTALGRLNQDLLLDPIRPPQILIYPSFMDRLPSLPLRITLIINTPNGQG
ncbi:MAG: hypothetical protein OHK0023_20120 [Anaerolineae bacterium]